MDRIDEHARATNTWGSNEHRHARDSRERDFEATLKSFDKLSDDQLDREVHFGGDHKRSPRDLPFVLFLRGWAYHDRWHMEDARRAIAGEPEQPFGDEAFAQAMQSRAQSQAP